MVDYGPITRMKTFSVTGCPAPGEMEGPDWTAARVTCRSCGRTLGHGQLRRGRARLTLQCPKCRRKTVRVFPWAGEPGLAAPLFDGVAGTQVMRCARGHVLATVEQEPEGVQSVWWLHCPECRKEMRWPATERERRLTSSR